MGKRWKAIALLMGAGMAAGRGAAQELPAAPAPRIMLVAQVQGTAGADAASGNRMTRQEAEDIAVKNNPRIGVSTLLALAEKQRTREARADLLPTLNGNVTGVAAEEGSRISSGTIDASRMLNHVGAGLELRQLITNFGKTTNLTAAAALRARASDAEAQATREEIVLAADLAYYGALEAQASERVAESTVAERQTVRDQVAALAASKLKSTLDLSFADVGLSEAKLLRLDARNQADSAMAELEEVLGTAAPSWGWQLVSEDGGEEAELPETAEALVAQAMQERPDLQGLGLSHAADVRTSRAERAQLLPTVSGVGVVGTIPVGSSTYFQPSWYGAAGVNIEVPLFSGFRLQAEASEAALRARASDEATRELRDRITRDVRTAWLGAETARERMTVTGQLLAEASKALELAQTRYRLGLSSIVELSQAELQQTEAAMSEAKARLEWEAALATVRFATGG